MGTDRSFDSNVRNFLAEKNSPNCFGKVKEFTTEFSTEEGGSDCTNTFDTYTIESEFETWNKVNKTFSTIYLTFFIFLCCLVG